MQKQDIKDILISMRTPKNETKVNFLLGKIDMASSEELSQYLAIAGNSEEAIRGFLKEQLEKNEFKQKESFYPINQTFTYGISEDCIHLHFPKKSYEIIKQPTISKTFDMLHLNLLDAIHKIGILKENNFYRFANATNIFMISPKLSKKTLSFLSEIDFQTTFYREKDLKNKDFVSEHPDTWLGLEIFGSEPDFKNLGVASIKLDLLSTPEWQDKYKAKIQQFNQKGIFLQHDPHEKTELY